MKMSDVWNKELTYGTYNNAYVGSSKLSVGFGMLFNNEEPAIAICHAVNNHDRMADEIAELRDSESKLVNETEDLKCEIEDLRNALSVLSDADNHSVSQVRMAMRKSRELLNK
ncbi:coil containing protein [Vibrio phage 1.047.O._10N.286.55.F2]|nr:coil containing protein [Vibrio phage 1.047.O._10N.286.55.F2]